MFQPWLPKPVTRLDRSTECAAADVTTPRETSLVSGVVAEATFGKTINPRAMAGGGLARA
jgi:hypothetical protein